MVDQEYSSIVMVYPDVPSLLYIRNDHYAALAPSYCISFIHQRRLRTIELSPFHEIKWESFHGLSRTYVVLIGGFRMSGWDEVDLVWYAAAEQIL